MFRPALLTVACTTVLFAQGSRSPTTKLQRGFTSLSNGTWEQALREWNEDGTLSPTRCDDLRARLGKLGHEPKSLGDFTAFHPPLVQNLWQRHWVLATFDTGAAFFCFDFQSHKGEWRLFRLEVSGNPQELLPNLDEKSLPVRVVDGR